MPLFTNALAAAFVAPTLCVVTLRLWIAHRDKASFKQMALHLCSGVAVFCLIGPAVGWLVILLIQSGSLSTPGVSVLESLWFLFLVAYLFGLIPAFLAGVVAGALRPWLGSWPRCAAFGVVGSLFSALMTGAVFNTSGPSFRASVNFVLTGEAMVFQMALAGFVAALLSSRIFCIGDWKQRHAMGSEV